MAVPLCLLLGSALGAPRKPVESGAAWSSCDAALEEACSSTKSEDVFACAGCTAAAWEALEAAGCDSDTTAAWCVGVAPPSPPPTLPKTCSSAPTDCPIGQYCGSSGSCYSCDNLSSAKAKCDALGGDCCSAAFLRNCPSDPKKAACAAAQSPCDAALQSACGSERGAAFDCVMCAGSRQQQLRAAGCANDQIHAWCEGPSAENFPGSRLLTPEWGAALNGWAGKDECQEWALCCSTFDDCESAGEFHAGCDGRTPTLTVVRNAGNFTFGGFVRCPPCLPPISSR